MRTISVQRFSSQRAGHLGERNVHRRQHHAQRVGVEHHHRSGRTGEMGEQVGVALPRESGGRKGLLVDRRGGDRRHPAGARIVHRCHDGLVGGATGVGAHPRAGEALQLGCR